MSMHGSLTQTQATAHELSKIGGNGARGRKIEARGLMERQVVQQKSNANTIKMLFEVRKIAI